MSVSPTVVEQMALIVAAVLVVALGTWIIGELSPRVRRRGRYPFDSPTLNQMKSDLQRSSVRWLSVLVASVIGAYKLKDVIDLIIAAIK